MTSPIAKRDSQRFLVHQSAILPFCSADDENHFLIGLCHRKPKLKGYNSNSTFISSFHPPPPPENGVAAKFVSPAKLTFLVKCDTQMTFVPENVANSKEQAISLFPLLPLIPYVTHVTSSPR